MSLSSKQPHHKGKLTHVPPHRRPYALHKAPCAPEAHHLRPTALIRRQKACLRRIPGLFTPCPLSQSSICTSSVYFFPLCLYQLACKSRIFPRFRNLHLLTRLFAILASSPVLARLAFLCLPVMFFFFLSMAQQCTGHAPGRGKGREGALSLVRFTKGRMDRIATADKKCLGLVMQAMDERMETGIRRVRGIVSET